MNRLSLLGAFALVALGPTAHAADGPDAVFDRYVAAVHAGDMAAVRALIAPDVERSDFVGCRPEMSHPDCLAHYIEATVVRPKARLSVLRRQTEGDTVSVTVEVRSPLYTQAGVERIVGRDIVRAQGGLIRAFRFVPDFSDEATAVFFGTLGIGPRAAKPAQPS
ncbi:nuclear transport factor 2 family protein [Ideonella sp. 4Y16]|uniref:nuclear transport factor 2 family protein n=1 Tax=Ideonella alba TaxID=2824118 RepID=UPI001B391D3E|nr:nuclear transport factor 2 family protein [Ideonella alba]MBQ0944616.1 nuclear transport factor 2 family protein [Ideonella alba]